jgi:hypothetical protein
VIPVVGAAVPVTVTATAMMVPRTLAAVLPRLAVLAELGLALATLRRRPRQSVRHSVRSG